VWDNTPQNISQIHEDDTSLVTITYSDVQGGWPGQGNIDAEPFFVSPGYRVAADPRTGGHAFWVEGDYHLQSETGRWDPDSQSWVKDGVTSPCIDAGDPASDCTAELWPHGGCINIGALGSTPEASMSLSDVGNVADLNIDDIVDLQDFANLARCWQMEQALLPEDLDRDGTVGLIDVAVFAEHWLEVPAVPGVENFETADFSKFPWEHAGDTSWAVTSQRQHSGAYSAKAGSIGHNESTTLQVGLDCGSGNISFLRRVSCEAPRDNLKFYIDGVETATWSGEEDWAEVSFGVTAGRRTFTWTYSKSRSGSEGDDTAWIDDIVFPLRLDPPQPAGVIELTDATFDQIVLGSDVPVLVDFWATWCGPCMMMAPVIEEIAEEYAGRAKVCKIDVDDARDIPMAYGINAIPTFILFKGGQIERKWIGVTSKEELANAIDELL
jgi:thioredoxin 1